MKSPTRFLRDIAAPTPEALFERAKKDEKTYDELSNGTEVVPIFNPAVKLEEVGDRQYLEEIDGTTFGTKQLYDIETDFGIDYAAALYKPLGQPDHEFYIDIDTALCTGIGGLNDEVAIRFLKELNVPVILKGPEFSSTKKRKLWQLASVALAATNISQSFTAETSMAISEKVVEREGLPHTAVVYGKSRAGMIGGKKYSYAYERGIAIPHFRLIDPSVGERALEDIEGVVRYALWPATDLARSIPSFAKFALEGNLRSRAKTIETGAAYLTGMVLGTVPSMLSGENIGRRIPLSKGVSLVQMQNNRIADADKHLEQFAHHHNFDYHSIVDTHVGGIILPRNIRRSVRHLKDFASEFDAAGGDETKMDFAKVHNNPKKASVTQIHAA